MVAGAIHKILPISAYDKPSFIKIKAVNLRRARPLSCSLNKVSNFLRKIFLLLDLCKYSKKFSHKNFSHSRREEKSFDVFIDYIMALPATEVQEFLLIFVKFGEMGYYFQQNTCEN